MCWLYSTFEDETLHFALNVALSSKGVIAKRHIRKSPERRAFDGVFRESEKCSTTYAIVFFFLPTFQWKFLISQTVHTIFIKFCSYSTPKGVPACAKASKSYDWDLRNSQKWPKNSHFSTFFDFLKICPYDSNEIFYSPFLQYGPMCAISINFYGWDSSESEGNRPKPTPLPHMRLWFKVFTFCTYLTQVL